MYTLVQWTRQYNTKTTVQPGTAVCSVVCRGPGGSGRFILHRALIHFKVVPALYRVGTSTQFSIHLPRGSAVPHYLGTQDSAVSYYPGIVRGPAIVRSQASGAPPHYCGITTTTAVPLNRTTSYIIQQYYKQYIRQKRFLPTSTTDRRGTKGTYWPSVPTPCTDIRQTPVPTGPTRANN